MKKITQSAGFEPARAEPNRFLVYRLNHSATTADKIPIAVSNFYAFYFKQRTLIPGKFMIWPFNYIGRPLGTIILTK